MVPISLFQHVTMLCAVGVAPRVSEGKEGRISAGTIELVSKGDREPIFKGVPSDLPRNAFESALAHPEYRLES